MVAGRMPMTRPDDPALAIGKIKEMMVRRAT
jgi:hypothetical protein